MFQLAASTSGSPAFSVVRDIPIDFWIRLGLAVALLVGTVVFTRRLAKANPVVLGVVVFVGLTMIGFTWIYERNEPAWATPTVQWLSAYFPTKAGK